MVELAAYVSCNNGCVFFNCSDRESILERSLMPILFTFFILDVAFMFIALNFRKVEIEVDQKCVRVSYGILKTTISAVEIVSCAIAEQSYHCMWAWG